MLRTIRNLKKDIDGRSKKEYKMFVHLIGQVTIELEEKVSKTGKLFWSLGLSTTIHDKSDNANKKLWISAKIFKENLLSLKPYLTKGKYCWIAGNLRIGAYLNREGIPTPDIAVFVDDIRLLPRSSDSIPETPKRFSHQEAPSVHDHNPVIIEDNYEPIGTALDF